MSKRYFTTINNEGVSTVYRRDGRYGDTAILRTTNEREASQVAWNKNMPLWASRVTR